MDEYRDEIEMAKFHGYHVQSDGIICSGRSNKVKIKPKWEGSRWKFRLKVNGVSRGYDAYKLIYFLFADDIPENFWTDDCEVYPANGTPLDLHFDNLEMVTTEQVENTLTRDQISKIMQTNYRAGRRLTMYNIADMHDISHNIVRFVINRYSRRKREPIYKTR